MNEVIKQFDTMRRSNSLPSRRVVKNSRFLLDRDEVHLCILCFRAIMNYQYGLTECVRNFSKKIENIPLSHAFRQIDNNNLQLIKK